jgi:hypothetical protein
VIREEIRDAIAYREVPPPLSRRVRRPTAAARLAMRSSGSGSSGAGSTLRRARARSTK